MERGADNPGGRSTAALGIYCEMTADKEEYLLTSSFKAPDIIGMALDNHRTSGTPGSPDYGNAYADKFTEGRWSGWGDNKGDMLSMVHGGVTIWEGTCNGNPYIPKGWTARVNLMVMGSDKDDVINKLENYLAEHGWNQNVDADDELPEVVYNYDSPSKAGNIY